MPTVMERQETVSQVKVPVAEEDLTDGTYTVYKQGWQTAVTVKYRCYPERNEDAGSHGAYRWQNCLDIYLFGRLQFCACLADTFVEQAGHPGLSSWYERQLRDLARDFPFASYPVDYPELENETAVYDDEDCGRNSYFPSVFAEHLKDDRFCSFPEWERARPGSGLRIESVQPSGVFLE